MHSGKLLQIVYPGDGARVLYRYHPSGQLAEVRYLVLYIYILHSRANNKYVCKYARSHKQVNPRL